MVPNSQGALPGCALRYMQGNFADWISRPVAAGWAISTPSGPSHCNPAGLTPQTRHAKKLCLPQAFHASHASMHETWGCAWRSITLFGMTRGQKGAATAQDNQSGSGWNGGLHCSLHHFPALYDNGLLCERFSASTCSVIFAPRASHCPQD